MLISHRGLGAASALAFALLLDPALLHGQTLVANIQTSPQPSLTNPQQLIVNSGSNKVYVAGDQGRIDILNASTNKKIGSITPPTTDVVMQFFTNTATGRTYALTATTILMIDGATDAIAHTLAIPNTTFIAADYIPAADRLYVVEKSATTSQLVVLDGSTFAQTAVLISGPTGGAAVPTMLVAVPAKNQVFGFFPGPGFGSVWVWDGSSNTIIDQSSCPSSCTKGISGHIAQAVLDPIDNSVWTVTYFQQVAAGGGDEGSGPELYPFRTILTRVNVPLSPLSLSSQFFGAMAISAFDPSGKIVGFANCVPKVANPSASTAPCANTLSGLYATDSAAPIAVDSPIIDLNSFISGPASTNAAITMCASGIVPGAATIPLGYDPDLGNGYWSCNGNGPGPVSNVSIVKYNLAQASDTSVFPPRILGQSAGALPTHALHQPTLITVMALNRATHRAFFPNASDNAVMSVDPVGSTLVTELLSSRPATLAVNPTTNTIYVGEDTGAQITTVDGATNTVTTLHESVDIGPYIAVNPNTNQVVFAGATDTLLDPSRSTGAFLYDVTGTTLLHPLNAAAVGGFVFDPSVFTAGGADLNPVTNRGYFIDQMEWYVVDLSTGNRLFTGHDFAGGTTANQCQFSGMAVNSVTNQYYMMGQCPASANGPYTLGVFDGNTNQPIKVTAMEQMNLGFGGGWGRMAVNPNTNRLYLESISSPLAVNAPIGAVVIGYDATTLARVGVAQTLAGQPQLVSFPLAINTATNRVYATISSATAVTDQPQMVLLDGSVDAFGRTDVILGTVPNLAVRAITVNPATGLAYVASDILLQVPGQAAVSGPGLNVFQEPPVPPKFSVSGAITKNGAPAAGMSVLIGDFNSAGATVVTSATGAFTLSGLPPGNYFVTPDSNDFIYTPTSQTFTIAGANVTGLNFTASPAFKISGRVLDGNGNGIAGQTVQIPLGASSETDATGAFTLTNVVPGTYNVIAMTPACCFFSTTVTVTNTDVTGVTFRQLPPVGVSGLSFNPMMIGANVTSTGTVTLSGPAPAGGIAVQIQVNSTVVKAPATVTVPAGATSANFTVQASGVNTPVTVTIQAVYGGLFSPNVTSAYVFLTVAPVDSLKVTSATFSKSTQLLTVNATSTNAQSTLSVILSSNNSPLGTMTNQGGGHYTFQTKFTSGTPAAINLKSNLGGSTGQGVSVVP